MDRQSFDEQLFTWQSWSDEGMPPLGMQYADVQLTVPMGKFAAGTKFPVAVVFGDISVLVLVDEQQEEHAFVLKISVGEEVEPPVMDSNEETCGEGCTHHH